MKKPPEIIYAGFENEDDEDEYLAAGTEPSECAIGIGERKIVGKYMLIETVEVEYKLHAENQKQEPTTPF